VAASIFAHNPEGYNRYRKKPVKFYGRSYEGDETRVFRCNRCGREVKTRRVFPVLLDELQVGEYNPVCAVCGGDMELESKSVQPVSQPTGTGGANNIVKEGGVEG
jgi:transcription elongation factor Elf1